MKNSSLNLDLYSLYFLTFLNYFMPNLYPQFISSITQNKFAHVLINMVNYFKTIFASPFISNLEQIKRCLSVAEYPCRPGVSLQNSTG